MPKRLTVQDKEERLAWARRVKSARRLKITQQDVAQKAMVTRTMVSKCIHRRARSAKVEAAYDRLIRERTSALLGSMPRGLPPHSGSEVSALLLSMAQMDR